MTDLWVILIPLLVADVVNPVLFAFMVYAAGTKQPVSNSIAVLIGHTVAYFSVGIVLALGIDQITDRLANPKQIDFVIELIIGILLLIVAYGSCKKKEKRQIEATDNLTPMKAFGLGAIVNFVGIPFALPYFAVLDQILKANLATADSLLVLVGYNLLYTIPFAAIPVLAAVLGDKSRPVLERINDVLDRVSNYLSPLLLLVAGLALIADAVHYFAKGNGLF